MHTWDPDRYLTYADERGRPFVELVGRIGAEDPRTVVDLGCGPGNLTALLAERWPGRRRARRRLQPRDGRGRAARRARHRLRGRATCGTGGRRGPSTSSSPTPPSSGCPTTSSCCRRWWAAVTPGGWLAFQVPGNFDEPSHTIRGELAAEEPYAAHTAGVAVPASHDPAVYLEALTALGCTVDAWETTYLHVLTGEDPVFTWVSGTGARPTLQALPDGLRRRVRGGVQAPAARGVPAARARRRAAVPADLRGGAGRGGGDR